MNVDSSSCASQASSSSLSLALAHWHSPNWLWFTAFVGANLFQASFTGFCPLAIILKRVGLKPGCAFN